MRSVQVFEGNGEEPTIPPKRVAAYFEVGFIHPQGHEYNVVRRDSESEAMDDLQDLCCDSVPEGANGMVTFYRLRNRARKIASARPYKISGKAADGARVFVRRAYA